MNNNRFLPSCWWMFRNFGMREAIDLVIKPRLLSRFSNKSYDNQYYYAIQKWIDRKYSAILKKYQDAENLDTIASDAPIWVMWWQGEDNMPEVIRDCFESLKRNSCDREIHLITKDNYWEYVCLPDFVLQKYEIGLISKTHLSDIIRAFLLSTYGGIWIDAAVYVLKPIDTDITTPFYSMNLGRYSYNPEQLGRWVISMMGCVRSYHAINFLYECLIDYWKSNNTIITYLFTDYLLCYYYNNNHMFKSVIDNLPINSPNFPYSRYLFNKPLDCTILSEYMNNNQFLSFSWRLNYHNEEFETYYDRMIAIINSKNLTSSNEENS